MKMSCTFFTLHPFGEGLTETTRGQVLIWNAADLEKKLDAFRHYYNSNRVHFTRWRYPGGYLWSSCHPQS
jgi:hypothetical protein